MFDFITQNFNWTSFLIGIAFIILIANLFNLIKAYLFKARADQNVKVAEKKLAEVMERMKAKQKELDDLLKRGETKL